MQPTFPVTLTFKFSLFTEVRVEGAQAQLLAVVKEKKFSLRDEVRVFADEARTQLAYTIRADGVLDWRATRRVRDAHGRELGALRAQGLRTALGARYDILGPDGQVAFTLADDHPWLGVLEGVIGAVPIIGDFVAVGFDYLVNPTYTVRDAAGTPAYRVRKRRSLFARRFVIEALTPPASEAELVVLALVQLVLRERERG
ncbi:hypothetical protein [Deinococcus maricopensis]|uniref:Uncharacterized protein n=1 Tax=Deinococcus maricopensis (strain DSM 21211 / LMG 22137 / NRRL B-23946 / LB-34) TaxID=709986 RepID=E8U5G5_DEIML|nr:hypothetical protein [Deinococcus maricopensis]ADV66304.1 hypothetical protein Deima_0647 [Deinococcus maricopensis DSM 21211]